MLDDGSVCVRVLKFCMLCFCGLSVFVLCFCCACACMCVLLGGFVWCVKACVFVCVSVAVVYGIWFVYVSGVCCV